MKLSIIFFITFLSLYAATNGLGLHTKKKLLIVGVGAKLLGKAAIGGIAGKKLVSTVLHKRRPCARATILLRKRRSIADYANRAFNGISTRLESTGKSLRNIGNTFHRGSDTLNSASLNTKVYGLVASERIRNLTRLRRATPVRRPTANLQLPSGKMSLDDMLRFVKSHDAEICLQRVICELSSKSSIYGNEGVQFGTRLLGYNNVSHEEAHKYRAASAYGNQNRNRPAVCRRKYSNCNIDPRQLIQVGNTILN